MIVNLVGTISEKLKVLTSVMISDVSSDCLFMWNWRQEYDCSFYELFLNDDILFVDRYLLNNIKKDIPYFDSDGLYVDENLDIISAAREVRFFDTKDLTDKEYDSRIRKAYSELIHQEDIAKYINHYQQFFNENTYGLHIRRGNTGLYHRVNILSPIDAYVKKIEEIIEQEPDARFFLATDSIYAAEYIYSCFGERIIYVDISSPFGVGLPVGDISIEAIKRIVVDTWLLSKTKKIYGNNGSLLTDVSTKIGNIEREPVIDHSCWDKLTVINSRGKLDNFN